ncbi:MAG: hypothetical protein IJ450_05430 [Bacteroidales bacterium]|nr:hypothetical protein [Bacteroidales bacterium]
MGKRFKLKIRAGETFLYRKGGTESQVFEIRMKSNIRQSSLTRAAKLAYRRYPYFKSRFKVEDGNVYLCENLFSPPPARAKRLRPLGGSTTNRNLVDITFFKNIIYISFHHAMCDGRGIMKFIKTLMYYYLNFRYPHNNVRIPGVMLAGEGFLKGETADPVNDGNLTFDKTKVYQADRTAFAIPEVQTGEDAGGQSWRYEIIFDVHEVMKVCKANNCTPAILMTIMMQKGVKALNPDAAEQILCSMSCDWRDSIEVPNTFRNCVSSIYLPYGSTEEDMELKDLGTHFRSLIARQKEVDSARCSASVMKMMSDMLDGLGSYEKKQEMVSGFTSRPINSFICSYTGKADMGDAEKYMESMHAYSSGTKGISLQMMSVADTFSVDFLQNFPEKKYAEAFLIEAEKLGLKAQCSDVINYITPKDHTANTNFLKSLIWFFRRRLHI